MKLKSFALFLPLSIFSFQVSANSDVCIHGIESKAHQARFIQSQLMVGTLQCRGAAGQTIRNAYNDYVTSKAAVLKKEAPILRAYLARSQNIGLDTYLTELANSISLSAALDPGYCADLVEASHFIETDRAQKGIARETEESAASPFAPSDRAFLKLLPVEYKAPDTPCNLEQGTGETRVSVD